MQSKNGDAILQQANRPKSRQNSLSDNDISDEDNQEAQDGISEVNTSNNFHKVNSQLNKYLQEYKGSRQNSRQNSDFSHIKKQSQISAISNVEGEGSNTTVLIHNIENNGGV